MGNRSLRLAVALCAVASVGCQGFNASPQVPSLSTYDVGARPRSVAAADLNDDGRRDVVVANSGDSTVTLLVGVESGRLQPLVPAIPCGNEPSDVDAIDLDHDGDVDLVVANHETSKISVLLNDGNAKFRPAPGSPFDSGARPHVHGLATGDFNGDGWSDVAVDSADTREIRVLQAGPRGLSEPISVAVGTMPYFRLGAADVTGDGIPDVLLPGQSDNTVRIVHRANRGLAMSSQKVGLSDKPWMVVGDDVTGDGETISSLCIPMLSVFGSRLHEASHRRPVCRLGSRVQRKPRRVTSTEMGSPTSQSAHGMETR